MNAGEDSAASGIFPPNPSTVYGALRSAYIHYHSDFDTFARGTDAHLLEWMGTPEQVGSFALQGVCLQEKERLVLPLPLDYQVVEESGREIALPLRLAQEQDSYTSSGSAWMLYGRSDKKSAPNAGAYLFHDDWKMAILAHRAVPVRREQEWISMEPKLGIQINRDTATAEDSMLYRMNMFRFKERDGANHISLCVYCRVSPDFSRIPMVRLGGEGRPWYLQTSMHGTSLLTEDEEDQLIESIQRSGKARIILLTPAIWLKGNRPASWSVHTGEWDLGEGLRVQILTAAIGRPQVIGGWDIVRNRPKPKWQAVPAGSVLVVSVNPHQAEDLVHRIHNHSLTDALAHEGYGWSVCGAVSEE